MPHQPRPGDPRVLVVVPTYQEADNIESALSCVHDVLPTAHLLVVDDASPDGTAEIVEELGREDERVHLLRRSGKLGLGTAYVAGFRWGLERGYDRLVEMDADGSHPADRLPALLSAVGDDPDGPALAIGSRWVPGGRVVDWPWYRQLLSRAGNAYARRMLRVPVHDVTAGFRVYRADIVEAMALDAVDSRGYCFQVDMTLRVLDAGGRIVEVPIAFRDRLLGTSKMSQAIIVEAMAKVTTWGLRRRLTRGRSRSRS